MGQADFDVIVAGAGAAGASAAFYLRQAGLSVLVIEKAELPRYKACGGAVPRQVLDSFPFDFGSVIEAAPSSVRFTFPGLPPADVDLPERPVAMVMRSRFDTLLLAHAGAELLEGVAVTRVREKGDRVEVEAGERQLTARYLVGADGAISTVARHLSLRQTRALSGCLEAEVPLNGNKALQAKHGDRALLAFGCTPWGYAWIFPKGDHLSVGIAQMQRRRVDLRPALRQTMEQAGIRPDGIKAYGHPLPCYQVPAWPIWRFRQQERLSTRRCVLVGDAGGLVDPLIGEGIRHAIASARLAARAIVQDDLAGYEAAVWEEIGHNLATAKMISDLFYWLPKLSYLLGVLNPKTVQYIVDIIAGKHSYVGIGRQILRATATWPMAKRRQSGTLVQKRVASQVSTERRDRDDPSAAY
jgi:geranylgeranyl reductase family protein